MVQPKSLRACESGVEQQKSETASLESAMKRKKAVSVVASPTSSVWKMKRWMAMEMLVAVILALVITETQSGRTIQTITMICLRYFVPVTVDDLSTYEPHKVLQIMLGSTLYRKFISISG